MAIIFVRSGATGANNGTSWADAFTSFSSATAASAGDFVYVAEDHSQNYGVTTTVTFANGTPVSPIKILCVNHTTGLQTTGAVITCGAGAGRTLAINGHLYVNGLTVTADSSLQLGVNSTIPPYAQTWEKCTVGILAGALSGSALGVYCGATNIPSPGRTRFVNCTLDLSNGSNTAMALGVQGCSTVDFSGGSILFKTGQVFLIRMGSSLNAYVGGTPTCILEDLDLSALPGTITEWGTSTSWMGDLVVRRCKVPASLSIGGTPQNRLQNVTFDNCSSGTITVPPLGLTAYFDFFGNVQADLSHFRTGGATDGLQANPYAWAMAASANALPIYGSLQTPPLAQWVAGGSAITVTVYVASGVTLDNSQFWIELDGPDNTASPNTTSKGFSASTRCDPLATPAALTTDTVSTWNGTGVGTKQKVSITYTPAVAGPLIVQAFLADASTTAYVDPAPIVS